jgi:hypothetical protein
METKIRQRVLIEAPRVARTSIEEQPSVVLSWRQNPRAGRQREFRGNVGRHPLGQHAYRHLEIGTLREDMARQSDQEQCDGDLEKRRHAASSLVKRLACE